MSNSGQNFVGEEAHDDGKSLAADTARPEDDRQQAEFRNQYRLQMERLSCPGCGEDASYF